MSFNNDKLLNLIRAQAAGVLSQFSHLRVGQISSYDPNNYSAKVIIQPEGVLTGSLPILTPWMGNLWGFYAPPSPGDSVVIHFMEGSFSVGFIGERIYTSIDHPIYNPGPPSGECWMVHKTGTFLKFHNDGTIEIKTLDSDGNPTNVNITSNIVMTGNLTVNGNILAQGSDTSKGNITATSDILDNSSGPHINTNNIRDMRTIYDSHTHGGVSAGGANTLDPNQPM